MPLCDSELSYEDISDFIEKCWKHDYGDELRLRFTPDFLRLNIPQLSKNVISFTAYHEKKLEGMVLGFDLDFNITNRDQKAAIGTGLSTAKEFRGRGISQLLHLLTVEAYILHDYSFVVTWMDIRHDWKGSSYRTYVKEKSKFHTISEVPIYAKSIDYKKTIKYTNLSFFEKIGLKAISKIFHSNNRLDKGFELIPFTNSYAYETSLFIKRSQGNKPIIRIYSEEDISHKFGYRGRQTSSIAYLFLKKGDIFGIIHGFSNPVNQQDNYFQVDGIYFSSELNYFQKKKMISAVEEICLKEHNCFSVIVPSSCSFENLNKFGYQPMIKQNLCNVYKKEGIKLDEKIQIELR